MTEFEIVGEIKDIETIATGRDGTICDAEIHWFEARGVGKRRAGRTNRFCYESAILQGRQENSISQSLVDRLSIFETFSLL
jgi:hypothetical protein